MTLVRWASALLAEVTNLPALTQRQAGQTGLACRRY
jgi:hypothetical protein